MIKTAHSLLLFQALLLAVPLSIGTAMAAGTAYGVIEGRPAAVARRACIGGESRGDLCNDNGDCPGSTCFDRNIFNLSVAVLFDLITHETQPRFPQMVYGRT